MEEPPIPPSAPLSGDDTPQGALAPLSLLRDIAISVVFAVILIVFIYQPVKVEGTSMMPGLTNQERIFINKYEYKLSADSIRRGDLVVFHFPLDPSQSYIKRVVGLPGDSIEVDAGIVLVNDRKLDEPYVLDEYRDRVSLQKEAVPAGHYFVLGDHRNSSSDSRVWGFVDRGEIYGKAVFVYWPLNRIGRVH
jgi:signal peptidase I